MFCFSSVFDEKSLDFLESLNITLLQQIGRVNYNTHKINEERLKNLSNDNTELVF